MLSQMPDATRLKSLNGEHRNRPEIVNSSGCGRFQMVLQEPPYSGDGRSCCGERWRIGPCHWELAPPHLGRQRSISPSVADPRAFGPRSGRPTLAGWIGKAAIRLMSVNDRLVAHLNRSSRLFMGETRATVLDSGTRIDELFPWNFKTGVEPKTACSRSCHA